MLEEEARYEEYLREKSIEEWKASHQDMLQTILGKTEDITKEELQQVVEVDINEFKRQHETDQALYKNFQTDAKESEFKERLEKKKKELLEKYFAERETHKKDHEDDDIKHIIEENEDLSQFIEYE
eukprot:TRINITY_DN31444_c0_g1_i1.p2 TRINITY_DN31444_c0_g1~~TRINITY_DN31444_c0_g1_i1.p2  ORF type:complete len:126 (-),score=46.90 TRINITY_DN31444_c0_g1_i1:276-653(-)